MRCFRLALFALAALIAGSAVSADARILINIDKATQRMTVTVDGTTRWSEHAYGRAIDLNPIENPYVTSSGTTSHRASRPYLRRAPYRAGMAVEGGAVVRAFEAAGWSWGGRWSGSRDYQHFSASGR